MKPKTLLLTGATGFLGSHLLETLLDHNHTVVVLKRSTSDLWRIHHLLDRIKSYDIDLQPLELAFEEQQIQAVFHTACHYGRNQDPMHQIVQTNLLLGLRLLDACLQFNTDTFFNTDTLLQKYLNSYTLSKKQFVEWLKQQSDKIQVVNLKLEHMYGPKDGTTKFVPWVLSQLKQNVPEIRLTAGEQKRDFIYIDDVVSAYLTVLNHTSELGEFNEFEVGTGELVSLKDFIIALKDVFEAQQGKVKTKLKFGAIPYRQGEMMSVNVDNQALVRLGWRPVYYYQKGLPRLIKGQRH
jgi:nucleoside-diphosphate-sugar epimerase